MWNTGEDLTADCLNDLHSSNNELCRLFGCDGILAYDDNSFRFRITEDPKFQLAFDGNSHFGGFILLNVGLFSQAGFCCASSTDFIEIRNVSAEKLLQLVAIIHKHLG